MADEATRQLLIQAMQGDEDAINALADRMDGVPTPSAEEIAVQAGQQRADWLAIVNERKDDLDELKEAGLYQPVTVPIDKGIAEAYPNADPRLRLDEAINETYRRHGTPAQRTIWKMKQDRQPWLKAEEYIPERPEEPTEFDIETREGAAEGIEQLRQGRAGRVLTREERVLGLEALALKERRAASGG
jgi:hypothetical protein